MQPVIKWTGSKRIVAKELCSLLPQYNRFYDPFVGGGSMTFFQHDVIASDVNSHVIELWKMVRDYPETLFEAYVQHSDNFKKYGRDYYFEVRDEFNKSHNPVDFFFINRTAVNGLIRYNKSGEFNAALGYGRNGIQPKTLKPILDYWHEKIQNYEYYSRPYWEITPDKHDFVFCDPPYENTDSVYFGSFDYENFISWLQDLTENNVKWMVTTRTQLDPEVYLYKIQTSGGNSNFRNLNGAEKKTVSETVYMNYFLD